MLHQTKFGTVIMVAVLLTACAIESEVRLEGLDAGGSSRDGISCPGPGSTCVPVDPPPDKKTACPDTRWIALRDPQLTTSCPAVAATGGTWKISLLFDPADATLSGAALPAHLRPYCVYDWQPSSPNNPPDTSGFGSPPLSSAARDCMVVSGAGSRAITRSGMVLRDAFRRQVDAVARLDRDASIAPAPVWVAVIDSSPDAYDGGRAVLGSSGHGHGVARIIRELACPDPTDTTQACLADVHHILALDLRAPGIPDPVNGGYFGTLGGLAAAIGRAVREWADAGGSSNLIINLSVGWEPYYGGAFSGTDYAALDPATRSVYAAMQEASCNGALIFAAAGNDPGGPIRPSSTMFPAGWNAKDAPLSADCLSLGSALAPATEWKRPTVYAVGGVDFEDAPLLIGRPGSEPPLVATADNGVVAFAAGATTSIDPLRGTSVAAAVASAAASIVWGFRPRLDIPDVVSTLYDAATPLGRGADVCLEGVPCPTGTQFHEVRRLSVCNSMRLACATPLEACPPTSLLPTCLDRPAHASEPVRIPEEHVTQMVLEASVTLDASAHTAPVPPLAVCGSAATHVADPTVYPESPCPERQYHGTGITSYTVPQPGSAGCGVCPLRYQVLEGSISAFAEPMALTSAGYLVADLAAEINDDVHGSLFDPVLVFDDTHRVVLPNVGVMTAGDLWVFKNITVPITSFRNALLSFSVSDGTGRISTRSYSLLAERRAPSSCCTAQSTPGCGEFGTEACVCDRDAYCCDVRWDSLCALEVVDFGCGVCDPGACCAAQSGPGCGVPSVEACVCPVDAYCCDVRWDEICVREVGDLGCGTCP